MARNRLLKLSPLDVEKIQYASPGELILRGNKKALSNVSDILDVFDEKWSEFAESYRKIQGVLRKERLLRAGPSAQFSSDPVKNFVRGQTQKFASNMQLENIAEIYEACDRNVLIFAKVTLSIFRRANEVYKFHAEGRVQRAD
jgi:hypothetical protein